MDKKLVSILVVILIIVLGIYAVIAYNSTYNAKVGSSSVSIPEGFEVENTENGTIIKNNQTEYVMYELSKNISLDDMIEDYNLRNDNYTIDNKQYQIGAVNLSSVTIKKGDKSVDAFYLYDKNEKIYKISTKGEYNKSALQTLVNTTTINPVPFM